MLEVVNGGLVKGGVGICRIGRGGVLEVRGLVIFGMEGIKGGRLRLRGFFFFVLLVVVGLVVVF